MQKQIKGAVIDLSPVDVDTPIKVYEVSKSTDEKSNSVKSSAKNESNHIKIGEMRERAAEKLKSDRETQEQLLSEINADVIGNKKESGVSSKVRTRTLDIF